MRTLGLIPARGGSKGIPRKNVRPLAGKPLLQYTAAAAHQATRLTRTLLTTEDPEIAALGQQLGLWVPFLRPTDLAQDTTPTLPVLLHAIEWLHQQGEIFDAYCLLQPTTPLRTAADIDGALTLLAENADAVVSVVPVPTHYHAAWQLVAQSDGALNLWPQQPLAQLAPRRQDLPPTYVRNGAIYAFWHRTLVEQHSIYGQRCLAYPMPAALHINLDTEADWQQAEQFLAAKL